MSYTGGRSANASDIARFLERPLHGEDFQIVGVSTLGNPAAATILFAKKFTSASLEALSKVGSVCVLAAPEFEGKLRCTHIIVDQPRMAFAKVVSSFFIPERQAAVSPNAAIASSASIGKNVSIGHYCVIGEGVQIGDNTEIRNHVTIAAGVRIGSNCLVKSHTVIGEEGFGFEFEEDGTPFRIPHLGSVVVGNNVEIGAANVIARGTVENTVLSDHVKTDDMVFIAHNAQIGENAVVIAGAEVSGSVKVGRNVWIGPQVSIINGVEIGERSLIGIGAVITKNVPPNQVMVGNPGKAIRQRFPDPSAT